MNAEGGKAAREAGIDKVPGNCKPTKRDRTKTFVKYVNFIIVKIGGIQKVCAAVARKR